MTARQPLVADRPVVELDDVTKTYPDGTCALRGITLTIERSEMLAIVGPSGSGKSSLLNLVGTLDRPTTGTVRLDGHAVAGLDDRSLSALRGTRIGFVFQQFHLSPGVVALDAVADGLLYSGLAGRSLTRSERRERAEAALVRVGLGHRVSHRPHQLSGGEKQRVAIARAVVGHPPLLLADEPTGALDTAVGAGVVEVLRDLHRAGTTVVVITHDQNLARSLPRQVTVRDGLLVAEERALPAVVGSRP